MEEKCSHACRECQIDLFLFHYQGGVSLTKVALTEELKRKRFGTKDVKVRDGEDSEEDDDEENGNISAVLSKKRKKGQFMSIRRQRSVKESSVIPFDESAVFGEIGDVEDFEEQQRRLREGREIGEEEENEEEDVEGEGEREGGDVEEGGKTKKQSKKPKGILVSKKEQKAKKQEEKLEKAKLERKSSVNQMMEQLSMKSGGAFAFFSKPGEKTNNNENIPNLGDLPDGAKLSTKTRFFDAEIVSVKVAEKDIKNPKYKHSSAAIANKKPEKPWYASKEQEMARKSREDKMPLADLALEANDWKQEIDPMTENVYYLNEFTNEVMTTTPRAIHAKKQLQFENSKNKKSYDEAKKRIDYLELVTKKRMLISGYRKK